MSAYIGHYDLVDDDIMQMSTKENRNFTGTLMCVDHFGNLLLYDAVEEINTGTKTHKRVLNQVIISMDKLRAVSVLVCFTFLFVFHCGLVMLYTEAESVSEPPESNQSD